MSPVMRCWMGQAKKRAQMRKKVTTRGKPTPEQTVRMKNGVLSRTSGPQITGDDDFSEGGGSRCADHTPNGDRSQT
jgi:hypothetical protein